MQNYDVIAIGSTLVDIFIESNEFAVKKTVNGLMLCELLGDKIEVDKFTMTSGGGASNAAVGFVRQGFQTAIISEMGKDTLAEKVLRDLQDEKVVTRYVVQEKREETGMSVILVVADGRRTVLVHRAAASMLEKKDINWRLVEQSKWVHLTNVSGQKDLMEKLFSVVGGDHDPGLSWNPGKSDIKLMAEYKLSVPKDTIDILFVNEEEWSLSKPVQVALKDRIRQIIITNGNKGGRIILQGKEYCKYNVDHTNTVEVTGAGDAFAVGYVSAHLSGGDVDACLKLAKKNSASVVQYVGAKKGLLKKT
ncbi:MAG: carbohydrate kinase family protein [Patescibacteria group bacterium]